MNELSRRDFFCALAASVVAANCPLPIGFPKEPVQRLPTGTYAMAILDIESRDKDGMLVTVSVGGKVLSWKIGA